MLPHRKKTVLCDKAGYWSWHFTGSQPFVCHCCCPGSDSPLLSSLHPNLLHRHVAQPWEEDVGSLGWRMLSSGLRGKRLERKPRGRARRSSSCNSWLACLSSFSKFHPISTPTATLHILCHLIHSDFSYLYLLCLIFQFSSPYFNYNTELKYIFYNLLSLLN